MDLQSVAIIAAAFAVGGILKGATGMGAPILAIPLMAIFFDMKFAVVVFSIPNVVPNIWQAWAYRRHSLPKPFVILLALAGATGAGVGTFLLANIPSDVLSVVLSCIVLIYVGFRLARPGWKLSYERALKIVFPIGLLAGALQGSSGLSAPVSMTFLTAMRLERGQFITTISVFFVSLGITQIPMLIGYGLLTPHMALLSASTLIPLVAFMPVGAYLVRHVSREQFDRVLLAILTVLSLKLLIPALF